MVIIILCEQTQKSIWCCNEQLCSGQIAKLRAIQRAHLYHCLLVCLVFQIQHYCRDHAGNNYSELEEGKGTGHRSVSG